MITIHPDVTAADLRGADPAELARRLLAHINVGAPDECWPWKKATAGRGYQILRTQPRAGSPTIGAHRIALILSVGPLRPEVFACHHCDNPSCCNPAHLFAGTVGDNNRDCRRKGRGARPTGESNPAARLTEADVREMRRLSAQGTNAAEIGRRFGISRSHAHAIVHGQRWSNR